jgi:putative membrane protein
MSNAEVAVAKPRSLAKGLIAGLIGGVAGTVAMAIAERIFLASAQDETEPGTKHTADGIRWGFGAAVGAAYGAVAEFYPAATTNDGASFGVTLEALAHQGMLPAVGLLTKKSAADGATEMTAHLVYGVATETVRGFVRKRL